jgi:hypothetical protein
MNDKPPDTPHPSNRHPMTEETATTYHRLRRLQEHSRSNIPALIAQRSTSTFTLHKEPLPPEANARVLVVVYPQDPFIGEPEVRTMNVLDINPGLVNSRVRIEDDGGQLAQPDSDGNYLYWPGTPQFDQINSFYYTTFTLRMYERYARRALPWSFPSPRITVNPSAGTQANAFYSEQDRMLGFHSFELDGVTVSTAHSADIVSHEAGHAVLDGLRDLYNESFGLGPTAFHESFGDMTAMLVALHDDSLVRRLLDWTNGDLRLDNFVARVAEQLTEAIIKDGGTYLRGHTVYLRNALNGLTKLPFDKLLYTPAEPEVELGRQAHNYSRLFTGAFYDVLTGIYEHLKQKMPPHIAIYRARDIAAYLLVCAVELGPVGEFTFGDMARAFLAADLTLYDGQHEAILIDVFDRRTILPAAEAREFIQQTRSLPPVKLPETINSALAAALFLENQVMPALEITPEAELIPMAAYRNATGSAYLTYFTSRRLTLTGSQYGQFEGASIDLFGGLTLMLDRKGDLRSAIYRPVTEEDEHQVRVLTADLVQAGLIADSLYHGALHMYANAPQGLRLPDTDIASEQRSSGGRLVKFPVSVDRMPARVPDLVEYLHKMQSKSGLGKTGN